MKPFGFLIDDQALSISVARFDLSAFIERNIPFPVMHRSYKSLKTISETTNLHVDHLFGDARNDAVRVTGDFNGDPSLKIDSVWVKASSTKYRKALEERNFCSNLIDARLPSALHADHVLNRASLSDVIRSGHEPWVLMFEVPASANTNFGSQIEKYLPKISPEEGQIHLSPAHIFKLYTTDWPKNQCEFEATLQNIMGQVNNANVVCSIRKQFGAMFP